MIDNFTSNSLEPELIELLKSKLKYLQLIYCEFLKIEKYSTIFRKFCSKSDHLQKLI